MKRAAPLAVVLAIVLAAGAALWMLRARAGGFTSAEVRWANGEVELAGTLYLPTGDGPHPAAAFAPGFGDWTRDGQLFRTHAERLARRGLSLLVYDKRGCGASGGDWRLASLQQLAGDALGAHELLRAHPAVDAERVGLFGTSQGALVAALAANREPSVAFVAMLSPAVSSAAEHDVFLAAERVRRAGFSDADARDAADLQRALADAARHGRPLAAADLGGPWLGAARLVPGPPGSPNLDQRLRAYRELPLDLQPLETYAALTAPVFAAQGTDDWVVPAAVGHAAFVELRDETDRDWMLALVPNAEHGLRTRAGLLAELLGREWTWPDEYWDALDAWLARVAPADRH